MEITVEVIQQIITMTITTLLTIFIIVLWLKKSTFNFSDLAYVMTYGGSDSASRYYGKSSVIGSRNEYSAYDCEYTTKTIMIDTIKDDVIMDRIKMVMRLIAISTSSDTAAIIDKGYEGKVEEDFMGYKNRHEIIGAKVDIRKMKRVDLGMSDKDIEVKYDTIVTLINDEQAVYSVDVRFNIKYSADWFALVSKVRVM